MYNFMLILVVLTAMALINLIYTLLGSKMLYYTDIYTNKYYIVKPPG